MWNSRCLLYSEMHRYYLILSSMCLVNIYLLRRILILFYTNDGLESDRIFDEQPSWSSQWWSDLCLRTSWLHRGSYVCHFNCINLWYSPHGGGGPWVLGPCSVIEASCPLPSSYKMKRGSTCPILCEANRSHESHCTPFRNPSLVILAESSYMMLSTMLAPPSGNTPELHLGSNTFFFCDSWYLNATYIGF